MCGAPVLSLWLGQQCEWVFGQGLGMAGRMASIGEIPFCVAVMFNGDTAGHCMGITELD